MGWGTCLERRKGASLKKRGRDKDSGRMKRRKRRRGEDWWIYSVSEENVGRKEGSNYLGSFP